MTASTCHCIVLRRATRRVSSHYDDVLAPLGINIAQFSLLRNIHRATEISLTELSAKVELDRSTVGRNIKVLEKMGLVASGPGEDKRESVLSLTAGGLKIMTDADPLWDQAQQRIEDRLGKDNLDLLHALLTAL